MKKAVNIILMLGITLCFVIAISILQSVHGDKKAVIRFSGKYEIQEKGDTLLIIKKNNHE